VPRQKRLEIRRCAWADGSPYVVDLGKIKQPDGTARRLRKFFQTRKEAAAARD
jgi:hypothetical protein